MRVTEKPDLLLLNQPRSHWLVKQEPVGDTAPMAVPASQPKQASQPKVLTPDPAAYTAGQPRPDLAAIELTLPAPDDKRSDFRPPDFRAGRRNHLSEAGGGLGAAEKHQRLCPHPNNAWRFLPLWLPCALRYQMAFLKANCGCIDIIMRCNNPQAPAFGRRLDDDRLQAMLASEMNHAVRRLSR